MAVSGRRNGMLEDDENDIEDGLLEEAGIGVVDDCDTPAHLIPLASAAESGDAEALRVALGSVDEPLEDGDTALHLACLYGHVACVQLLLERGASVLAKDEDGAIPLHDACASGFTEIVQLIIGRATNPEMLREMLDTLDEEADTPLHHAARGEHVNVVRLLLAHGASPLKKNVYDKTPGDLAEPGTAAKLVLEEATNAENLRWSNNIWRASTYHIFPCIDSKGALIKRLTDQEQQPLRGGGRCSCFCLRMFLLPTFDPSSNRLGLSIICNPQKIDNF
ncbi:hypothetical protein V2J09_009679 [Rumex salicifolius]